MNIAIFASAFHPSLGGVEELCRQLAHAYKSSGHTVSVWTERWPRDLPEFEQYEGIPVHRFAMRVPANSWKAKLSYAFTHGAIAARITREVQRAGVEILHVQCVSSTAWYALHVQRALRLPLVVTLQGELNMDAAGVFQQPGIGQRIMREALAKADAITGCSRQTVEEAEVFFGQPFGERSQVIYNGVSLREFEGVEPYAHPKPYILAIGRHVREKGFDILLRAFAEAGDTGHDLLVAGDGTEHASLMQQAAALPRPESLKFLGRVDHAMAVRLFKGCSFFVLPSRHEPLGMVNLEAMAAGKAVIASRVGGVPEIVADGESGLLVAAEDVQALSKALRQMTSDGALRLSLGEAGARRASRFDWADLAEQYLKVYQAARERTGQPASVLEVQNK